MAATRRRKAAKSYREATTIGAWMMFTTTAAGTQTTTLHTFITIHIGNATCGTISFSSLFELRIVFIPVIFTNNERI
jgi:CHASE2 domain-containing sensor protein